MLAMYEVVETSQPGANLLRDAASTDNVAAFEHESRVSRPRQIRGRSQGRCGRADDDGIVDGICHAGHKNDPLSKQQNALVEEGTERPLKCH